MLPLQCTVRFTAGAYVTNTVKGERASSTSSAHAAVELLASKLLPGVETVIASHPDDAKLWVVIPKGWTPPAGTPFIELHFSDEGQDFLSWSIEPTSGFVFETAQSWVWRGRRVDGDVRKLRVGDRVRLDDMEPGRALLYPISGISERVVQ